MAINENNVLMRYKGASGDTNILYPITKRENVDGLDALVRNQAVRTIADTKDSVGTWAYKLNAPKTFSTGSTPLNTGFKPFASGKDTWTIAVKYADGLTALNSDQWATLLFAEVESGKTQLKVATLDSNTVYPNCSVMCNAGGFALNTVDMGLTPYNTGYHTFIVTKNGDNYTFYLDNNKIYGNSLGYPQAGTGDNNLYVGGFENGWGVVKGTIMDIRIYNECLDDSSITSLNNLFATASDGCSAYSVTVDGITSLSEGATFVMIPHAVSSSAAPTLNVNNLGAKMIRRRLVTSTGATYGGPSKTWLTSGKPVRVTYDGTYWIADIPKASATDLAGNVPITNGGTGATTASDARKNLGAISATPKTLTLNAVNWSNNAQTISATGVTASNIVIVSPAPASYDAYGEAGVRCTAQAANSLTFTCTDPPSANLTISVVVLG